MKINTLEGEHNSALETTKKEYTLRLDNTKLANMQQTVKVFSWAVRSEMRRNNLEEGNNFFSAFIREKGIKVISLIDPVSRKIILSTDKKNEGREITDEQILNMPELRVLEDANIKSVITPIMGLNKKIGILRVDVDL